MKIAFISYEYPPDTALGGIATYVAQAARMLTQRGHHVEIFAAGIDHCETRVEAGIVVHRITTPQRAAFAAEIAPIFASRHHTVHFDILEATDIDAPAHHIMQAVPDIPLVVKLHTPTFLVNEISQVKPSLPQKLRWHLGTLRRGQRPKPYPCFQYNPALDVERFQAVHADGIAAPSTAIGEVLKNR
ncbi:MAG TPA: glycosyltransferase, partial [Allocoleopsis sp.]